MAKGKDPAFLFYPGDASEDTQFMNRLERGCYFDILKAQKKFRKFTLALIQKVLGNDFQACWPAIESVLAKDGDLYFIGWANDAIENRAEHSAKQKKRIEEYWAKKRSELVPEVNQTDTTEQPKPNQVSSLESENENEDEIVIKYIKESEKFDSVVEELSDQVAVMEAMLTDEIYVEQLQLTHRGKDIKQAFSECYIHHSNAPNPPKDIQGWKQKLNTWLSNTRGNGTSKKGGDAINARREAFARRHGTSTGN